MSSTAKGRGGRGARDAVVALALVAAAVSGPRAGAAPPAGAAYRLVYLYDSGDRESLARRARLDEALAQMAGPVELVAVALDQGEDTARQLPPGVSLEALLQAAAGEPDRLFVLHPAGQVVAAAGAESEALLSHLGNLVRAHVAAAPAAIATDINFSTWGKVKDLFR
ncbi:MAG: hypothetical protein ABIL09_01625 [Gemmatimonadota bacterium]